MPLGLPVRLAGSIPAPAGEPNAVDESSGLHRVYPRACGGTDMMVAFPPCTHGLSPRLRGNPQKMYRGSLATRSIPAPAGEPNRLRSHRSTRPVYPRACGGTFWVFAGFTVQQGLSPRLRGNHPRRRPEGAPLRSIPAPAGEPNAGSAAPCGIRVYPRACGGTGQRPRTALVTVGLSPRLRGNPLSRAVPDASGDIPGSIPAPAGEPMMK